MAEDEGRDTKKGGNISEQGDVGGLENGVNAIPRNSYPAGPDKDYADAGKVGPAIVHEFIPRRDYGRLF
jgi:hypothetical protein